MIGRFLYFLRTGWRDTRRSGLQLLVNAVIVVGICLPLLLLSGLKRGVVAKFKQDIQNSPTARQVPVTAKARTFDRAREQDLEASVEGVALVITQIIKPVPLVANGKTVTVTLAATRPGNPFLQFYELDVLKPDDRGVILSTAAADKLGIRYEVVSDRKITVAGQPEVVLTMAREGEGTHTTTLVVRGVYQSKDDSAGFAPREVMERLESFGQGRPVPDWGWPSKTGQPKVRYAGYLAFAESEYTAKDHELLHERGYVAEAVPPRQGDTTRTLGGVLRPHELFVYHVRAGQPGELASQAPEEVADITPAQDIVLAWTPPQTLDVGGRPHRVVGMGGKWLWLKEHLRHADLRLPTADDPMRVMLPTTRGVAGTTMLTLPDGKMARLTVVPAPLLVSAADVAAAVSGEAWSAFAALSRVAVPPAPAEVPLALVPAALGAYLAQARDKALEFDVLGNRFLVQPGEEASFNAIVYAKDVDHAPGVADAMQKLGYHPTVSFTRVLEVQGYARTLDGLVWLVTLAVGLFGLLTMGFVFWELTSRKSGAIAITRVMGMPSAGVVLMLLVRAGTVGMVGCALSTALSFATASALWHWGGVDCQLKPADFVGLLFLSIRCCVLGVLLPAWYFAVRLDPVDALLASRTH